MPKVKLQIYSRPEGTKECPPAEDLGGKVTLDPSWQYEPRASATDQVTPASFEVEVGSDGFVWIKGPAKNTKCNWEPVVGQREIPPVGAQGASICTEWRCIKAGALVVPLSGDYVAKRVDQATKFNLRLSFQPNEEYCLYVHLNAPGALDQGEAHLHSRTEPGTHGSKAHRGDFMQANAPLTECILQGTFRGPHGEQGSLRMLLSLLPAAQGLFTPMFGGFLTFANAPQANIETTFTKIVPVQWPGARPGVSA